MVIWKFSLAVERRSTVRMPVGAQVLSVHVQRGVICLWAKCDPEMLIGNRHFTVVGAGYTMPSGLREFIGTVLMPPFIWHVFECE